MVGPRPTNDVGIGYTLATQKLFCDFAEFQRFAEALLGRPILTHEFADKAMWDALRSEFESQVTHMIAPDLAGRV